jgi:hypothetical protein
MRLLRHSLPIILALFIAHPTLAQGGANTVLTGFAGVPWGASQDAVRSALGVPDSVTTQGDTTSLRYLRREFAGMQAAEMWASVTPSQGLVAGGYSISQPQCGTTFNRVRDELATAFPRLVPVGRPMYFSARTRSTNADTVCASGSFSENQLFRDPDGAGMVMVSSAAMQGPPSYLVVIFTSAYRGRALPGDGTRGSRKFSEAGVEMTVMPGFAVPRQVQAGSGRRLFSSDNGAASIRVSAFDAVPRSERWSPGQRLQYLQELLDGLARNPDGWRGEVQTSEALIYADVRFTNEGGTRPAAVGGRVYATRTGPFRTLLVAYTEPSPPQSGVDQALAEMLDSVHLAGSEADAR